MSVENLGNKAEKMGVKKCLHDFQSRQSIQGNRYRRERWHEFVLMALCSAKTIQQRPVLSRRSLDCGFGH